MNGDNQIYFTVMLAGHMHWLPTWRCGRARQEQKTKLLCRWQEWVLLIRLCSFQGYVLHISTSLWLFEYTLFLYTVGKFWRLLVSFVFKILVHRNGWLQVVCVSASVSSVFMVLYKCCYYYYYYNAYSIMCRFYLI